MSKEIDWSKAPEGATHARKHNSGVDWYKRENGSWLYYSPRGIWERAYCTSEADCVQRPAWNGTGLPPVGTVCELSKTDGVNSWTKVEIVYISKSCVVYRTAIEELCDFSYEMMFRQIRTPEQIAAEEREKAVSEMLEKFRFGEDKQEMLRAVCFGLYDAGYRKTEGVQ